MKLRLNKVHLMNTTNSIMMDSAPLSLSLYFSVCLHDEVIEEEQCQQVHLVKSFAERLSCFAHYSVLCGLTSKNSEHIAGAVCDMTCVALPSIIPNRPPHTIHAYTHFRMYRHWGAFPFADCI